MSRSVRNPLTGYLADLFVVGGAALFVSDALAGRRLAHGGALVADLVLAVAGALGHGIARVRHREAPVAALGCLAIAALVAAWLTGRW